MKYLLLVMMLIAVCFSVMSCVSSVDTETERKTYGLAHGATAKIDITGEAFEETAPAIGALLTALIPGVGGIVNTAIGGLITLFVLYKKWKKPLVELSDVYVKTASGARAAADVIDLVVKPNADLWKRTKPILERAEKKGAIMPDLV